MSQAWTIDVDPYTSGDRAACLRVMESNTPGFFAPDERAGFAVFLDAPPGPFWVARAGSDRTVVGCGGVSIADDGRTAWLRWGMVAVEHHGRGVGRRLMEVRLRWIGTQTTVETIRVATIGKASGFFQRMGFELVGVIRDRYGPGIDRHDLVLREVLRHPEPVSQRNVFATGPAQTHATKPSRVHRAWPALHGSVLLPCAAWLRRRRR